LKKFILFISFLIIHLSAGQNLDINSAKGLVNPPSRINVDGANLSISGDFLYWVAAEDGLFYSQDMQSIRRNAPPSTSNDINILSIVGNLNKINPKWDPGFRLSIGKNISYDKLDGYLIWTRYRTKKNDVTNNNALALWGHTGRELADFWQYSKAFWHLNFDELELQLGRASYMGNYFSLRPYLGLVLARITQKLSIMGEWLVVPEATEIGSDYIRVKSDFLGGGIRTGIDLDFYFHKNISLYALGSGSIAYGRFSCPYYATQDSSSSIIVLADSRYRWHQNIAAGKFAIGIKLLSYFNKDKLHCELKMGWEQNIWFGINKMRHYMKGLKFGSLKQEHNNLGLQGLDIKARLDF